MGYDDFNRLSSLTVTSGTQENFSYVYDRYGNRWQQNVTAGTGPSPQLSFNTANNQATNAGIQYDAAGNLINDSTHSYKYDADGNLISVDNGATAVYVYDALNRRVRVQTASATDEYIYDYANRRISTWLPNGAGIEGRIYWGSLLAAFRAQNGDTYFDQKDILGTDRLRMNYAAVAAANYASLPFGDGYTATVGGTYGDQDNNHFAQLDRDAESDTDHARFRQYYNTWGRWMSPDPYSGSYDITNPQSFNRYSYVTNNPLAFVDPLGLEEVVCSTITDSNGGVVSSSCTDEGGGDGGGGLGWGFYGQLPGNGCNWLGLCGYQISSGGGAAPSKSILGCAAKFASAHSIAGGLQAHGIGSHGGVGGFLTNAFGGNTFSGIYNLGSAFFSPNSTGQQVMTQAGYAYLRGPLQGIPAGLVGASGPAAVSPIGMARSAAAGGFFNSVTGADESLVTLSGETGLSTVGTTAGEFASGVGEVKFAVDALTFLYGVATCVQ